MKFEFATASRICFGPGAAAEAVEHAAALGRRALLVTGRDARRAEPWRARLQERGVSTTVFSVPGEPTLGLVREGVRADPDCQLVIGFGGGSALDAAKAIAALLGNGGDPLDYAEVIGLGRPITRPARPWIALPTTAGTGTEVTRNAVLRSEEHRVKVSLRSPHLLPSLAAIDPGLTLDLPREITAATGLDALTQLLEPFVSCRANPLADGFCREGLARVARSLRRACDCGQDYAAREDMALASLCGGLALANAGLGAVHGLAAVLGGAFPAPHGAVCASLLAPVMEANLRALDQRAPGHPVRPRFAEVARLLTGHPGAAASDGIEWVRQLSRDLAIPPLSSWGVRAADFPSLAEKSLAASSMKANPLPLELGEILAILQTATSGEPG